MRLSQMARKNSLDFLSSAGSLRPCAVSSQFLPHPFPRPPVGCYFTRLLPGGHWRLVWYGVNGEEIFRPESDM